MHIKKTAFDRGFSIALMKDRRDDNYSEHIHDCFEMLFLIKGRRSVRIDGMDFLAKSGEIIIFLPGEVHEEKTITETISYFTLRFYDEDLKKHNVSFPVVQPSFHVVRLSNFYEIMEIFNKILAEEEKKMEDWDAIKGAYFIEFVILLRRAFKDAIRQNSGNISAGKERIESAISYMRKNIEKKVDLSELAGQSFLSVSYFSQVFKEQTGSSPKQYLIKEKIERAKELLLDTKRPIKQIAEELGYEFESYFFKQFKSETGLTPLQFRKIEKAVKNDKQ
jgi:AraC-like DNA-binding protein